MFKFHVSNFQNRYEDYKALRLRITAALKNTYSI